MSYGTSTTGKVLGASTVLGGGIALLPNTSGQFGLSLMAIIAIAAGSAILLSLIATIIYKKFAK